MLSAGGGRRYPGRVIRRFFSAAPGGYGPSIGGPFGDDRAGGIVERRSLRLGFVESAKRARSSQAPGETRGGKYVDWFWHGADDSAWGWGLFRHRRRASDSADASRGWHPADCPRTACTQSEAAHARHAWGSADRPFALERFRDCCTAANQDIADLSSCICITPESTEEARELGVSRIAGRQASQDSSRLDFMRASLARARPTARSTGTWSPRPKYISSGVWPAKAEWGTTELCCST